MPAPTLPQRQRAAGQESLPPPRQLDLGAAAAAYEVTQGDGQVAQQPATQGRQHQTGEDGMRAQETRDLITLQGPELQQQPKKKITPLQQQDVLFFAGTGQANTQRPALQPQSNQNQDFNDTFKMLFPTVSQLGQNPGAGDPGGYEGPQVQQAETLSKPSRVAQHSGPTQRRHTGVADVKEPEEEYEAQESGL